MAQTLHVPVYRYVYKYCMAKFGEKTSFGELWRLSTRYKECKTLYAMLDRTPYKYEKLKDNECFLNVFVSTKIAHGKGAYLTQDSVDLFNDYIKQVIMDEILSFHSGIVSQIGLKAIDKVVVNQYLADKKIRLLRVAGSEAHKFFWQKSIIADILAKYNINENDLSTDAVVKYLQRYSAAQVSA